MNRRDILLGATAMSLTPLVHATPAPGLLQATQQLQRRVLFVDIDDLGRALLTKAMNTGGAPNLRRAMLSGRSYDNFWAAPFCSPFRARALTGLDAYRSGNLVGTFVKLTDSFSGPTGLWLPSGLPGAKAKLGKWHISNGPTFPANVVAGGYDRFRGIVQNVDQPGPGNYYNWTEWFADSATSGLQQVAPTQHDAHGAIDL